MKIAIVYHSEGGNTRSVAEVIAEGARGVAGTEVALMGIDAIEERAFEQARAVVVGFPVYAGSCSWQIKRWLDTTKLKLAGKLGSVFATENHVGGGADLAELVILGGLMVRGMLTYSAGASMGQPFTHFGAVAIRQGDDHQRERARLFGERVALKARELWES
jgi:NAD(P)H dehydrogenase (quinone)